MEEEVVSKKRNWKYMSLFIFIGLLFGISIVWYLQSKPVAVRDYRQCRAYGYPISGTSPQVCMAAGKIYPGPFVVKKVPETIDIPYQAIASISGSGNYPEKNDIITTQSQWEKYWDLIHIGSDTKPFLPHIDFTKKTLVAITEGPHNSRAVGIQILSVKSSASETIVSASVSKPGETCKAESVKYDPTMIIAFDIPTTPIRFDIKGRSQECDF